jgi:hypothetical protein
VGGRISLNSPLYITTPFLTVAGQTAPGEGIFISAPNVAGDTITLDNGAHDVIWNSTKIGHGFNQQNLEQFNQTGNSGGSNLNIYSGVYNVIFNHNSTYWNQDEGVGAWDDIAGAHGIDHITFSYNIIAEGLSPHSTGALLGGSQSSRMFDIDMHHNLFMNNSHRNPMVEVPEYRHVNNLTYNQQLRMAQLQTVASFIKSDWVRNIWKAGPLNTNGLGDGAQHPLFASGAQSIYLEQNRGQTQPDANGDQWQLTALGNGQNGPEQGAPAPIGWQRFTPLTRALTYPITAESVTTLEASLLPIVGDYRRLDCTGAWVNRRHAMDATRITQYINNTGPSSLYANETQAGGFPTMKSGTACTDTDHDGMPDAWEATRGLNSNFYGDTNLDRNGDGFTNLEEYLAGGNVFVDTMPPATPTGVQVR